MKVNSSMGRGGQSYNPREYQLITGRDFEDIKADYKHDADEMARIITAALLDMVEQGYLPAENLPQFVQDILDGLTFSGASVTGASIIKPELSKVKGTHYLALAAMGATFIDLGSKSDTGRAYRHFEGFNPEYNLLGPYRPIRRISQGIAASVTDRNIPPPSTPYLLPSFYESDEFILSYVFMRLKEADDIYRLPYDFNIVYGGVSAADGRVLEIVPRFISKDGKTLDTIYVNGFGGAFGFKSAPSTRLAPMSTPTEREQKLLARLPHEEIKNRVIEISAGASNNEIIGKFLHIMNDPSSRSEDRDWAIEKLKVYSSDKVAEASDFLNYQQFYDKRESEREGYVTEEVAAAARGLLIEKGPLETQLKLANILGENTVEGGVAKAALLVRQGRVGISPDMISIVPERNQILIFGGTATYEAEQGTSEFSASALLREALRSEGRGTLSQKQLAQLGVKNNVEAYYKAIAAYQSGDLFLDKEDLKILSVPTRVVLAQAESLGREENNEMTRLYGSYLAILTNDTVSDVLLERIGAKDKADAIRIAVEAFNNRSFVPSLNDWQRIPPKIRSVLGGDKTLADFGIGVPPVGGEVNLFPNSDHKSDFAEKPTSSRGSLGINANAEVNQGNSLQVLPVRGAMLNSESPQPMQETFGNNSQPRNVELDDDSNSTDSAALFNEENNNSNSIDDGNQTVEMIESSAHNIDNISLPERLSMEVNPTQEEVEAFEFMKREDERRVQLAIGGNHSGQVRPSIKRRKKTAEEVLFDK